MTIKNVHKLIEIYRRIYLYSLQFPIHQFIDTLMAKPEQFVSCFGRMEHIQFPKLIICE